MNLTPNFNLIQPEVTDPFEDFRTWYKQTLSIIDANLGGGGSKHTIVDENGQALPNRTYLEFTGGVQVTDDALNNKTVVDITGGGGGSSTLAGLTDVDLTSPTDGQVLTYDNASQKWINANPSGGGSHDYSTSEQVVGTWIDGKPLYEKSFIHLMSGTSGNIDLTSLAIDEAFIFGGFYDIGVTNLELNEYVAAGNFTFAHVNKGLLPQVIDLQCTWANATANVTLRYTKITD